MLLDAVRSGVALLTWDPDTFAYASAIDEATGRYSGLVGGQHAAVVLDAASVLVRPEAAARQLGEEKGQPVQPAGSAEVGTTAGTRGPQDRGDTASSAAGRSRPTRFYGRVSLEPVRLLRDMGEVADAIVSQLGRADATVKIVVEIEATLEAGFSDEVRRTVSENARTLKFDSQEFDD
ncbi:MAG: hypothetical protein ACR2HM_06580 [Acidimicrobiales bacterium]